MPAFAVGEGSAFGAGGSRRVGHPLPFHRDLLGEEKLQVLGQAASGRAQVEPEDALLDVRLHVGARLVPVFGILGERLGGDFVQLLGQSALQRPERGELGLPNLRKDLEGIVALEHAAARDQFV